MRAGRPALRALRDFAICALLALGAPAVASAAATPPLLALAEARHYVRTADELRHQGALIASLSMLDGVYVRYGEDNHCDSAECRKHLVAGLRDVGLAYSQLDLHLLSLNYYQAVLRYAEDEPVSYADVGSEYLMLGRYDEAGAAFAKALALSEGKDGMVEQFAAAYFLVANQIGKAREHYTTCVALGGDERRVQYCAIGLALTKKAASKDDPAPPEASPQWPGPALAFLRGESSEADLAHALAALDEPSARRERLSEALYYAGELAFARGEKELALRYFRANVALRVGGYLETLQSTRRIEQLHGNDDPAPHSAPASHVPIS